MEEGHRDVLCALHRFLHLVAGLSDPRMFLTSKNVTSMLQRAA